MHAFFLTNRYDTITTTQYFTDAKPYGYADAFGPAVLALFMATLL